MLLKACEGVTSEASFHKEKLLHVFHRDLVGGPETVSVSGL